MKVGTWNQIRRHPSRSASHSSRPINSLAGYFWCSRINVAIEVHLYQTKAHSGGADCRVWAPGVEDCTGAAGAWMPLPQGGN